MKIQNKDVPISKTEGSIVVKKLQVCTCTNGIKYYQESTHSQVIEYFFLNKQKDMIEKSNQPNLARYFFKQDHYIISHSHYDYRNILTLILLSSDVLCIALTSIIFFNGPASALLIASRKIQSDDTRVQDQCQMQQPNILDVAQDHRSKSL